MRLLIYMIFLCIFCFGANAQSDKKQAKTLSEDEIQTIFTPLVKNQFGINNPIIKVYTYEDKSGRYYLPLTQREFSMSEGIPTYDTIKCYNLKMQNGKLISTWFVRDFIIKNTKLGILESSMDFWTYYIELQDIDKDGLVDPILIYGSTINNMTEDGRLKFLIYYKGLKYAIRHQNGALDQDRNTQIDKEFYKLPKPIQDRIVSIMDKIVTDNRAIFPNGYKEKMKAKILYFDDKN